MHIKYLTWIIVISVLATTTYAANFNITARDTVSGNYLASYTASISYYDPLRFYQETANQATVEGGLATGTYGFTSVPASNGYMYINYSKPANSSSAVWQYKLGNQSTNNSTIPSSCFSAYSNLLSLRLYSLASTNEGSSYGECYNGTSYQIITTINNCTGVSIGFSGADNTFYGYDEDYSTAISYWLNGENAWRISTTNTGVCGIATATSFGKIFEEGIWWNVSNYTTVYATTSTSNMTVNINATRANVTVTSNGYNSASVTNHLISGNYSANLTPTQINITFIDENNFTRINWTTITAYVTGYNYSTNLTTTNGTAQINALVADNYTITYFANSYFQRSYQLVVSYGSNGSVLVLYLLPQSGNATIFQANVISLYEYSSIPNATVNLYKKNLTGTNYYQVDQCITAKDGKCLVSLQLYTTIYKFIISYNGIQRYDSTDEILADTSQTFQISITTDSTSDLLLRNNISTTITSTQNSMTVNWIDASQQISQACVTIYGRYKTTYTQQNRTCTATTSGTTTISGITSTGTDEVIGVVSYIINGKEFNYYSNSLYTPTSTKLGSVGFLMIGLGMPLTAAFAFLFHPVAAMAVFGLGIYLSWAGGFVSLTQGIVVSLLAIMLVFVLRMRT